MKLHICREIYIYYIYRYIEIYIYYIYHKYPCKCLLNSSRIYQNQESLSNFFANFIKQTFRMNFLVL